jgi:hypothetical protein
MRSEAVLPCSVIAVMRPRPVLGADVYVERYFSITARSAGLSQVWVQLNRGDGSQ